MNAKENKNQNNEGANPNSSHTGIYNSKDNEIYYLNAKKCKLNKQRSHCLIFSIIIFLSKHANRPTIYSNDSFKSPKILNKSNLSI